MLSIRSLFLLVLLPATVFGAVGDVEKDISDIEAFVTALGDSLAKFDGHSASGLAQALAIHNDTLNLDIAIQKATNDTKAAPGPVGIDEAQAILAKFKEFQPTIIAALDSVVAKKSDFKAVPIFGVPTIVKTDLTSLNASTKAFEGALIAKTPAQLVPGAQQLVVPVDDAFGRAVSAYKEF
ncbi:hypothetical protein AURDEDRAFT_175102 [Auricularia subglabra TFB-10046 SS5]|uniref:Hydrophobic surface binding protein n=1 Tax=Auricularia subglabra (strain TFB-10046 / SS5) TaxID=717982 RepID=J0D8N8_AURST|nr:hypothetical protein AURDEDRAFT_175102 [Auricularia subglabra TFB-10046 SS5]